jgi:hypothetical protein
VSSRSYATELIPDPRLRRFVLAAGSLTSLAGCLVAATLPAGWRPVAACAWLAVCLVEARQLLGGYRRYRRIRIDAAGTAALETAEGSWVVASIRPGSVVLGTIAWLRFDVPGAAGLAELVRGKPGESEAWRRFQVIWRHLGGGV